MKKYILSAVAALCAALCCFTACNSVSYDDLNSKLELNYSKIHLAVTDKFDKDTSLRSNYYMEFEGDKITVSYGIERFTEISLEDPSEYTKPVLKSGVAVIKNGKVVEGELDLPVDLTGVLPDGLDFKEEYFENARISKTSLFADVKDASGFLGTPITCTDMRVNASFGEAFSSITVTYKAQSGHSVEYLYEFGALAESGS